MSIVSFIKDTRAASAVEFAMTAPAFLAVTIGSIVMALLVFAQIGLQNATELAARCAGLNPGLCSGTAAIQSYAASNMHGFSVPASAFSVTTRQCGTEVSAAYDFLFVTSFFGAPSVTLTAKACFPK
jgi:uncharacterized membrane protein